jgi:hypothetical protein
LFYGAQFRIQQGAASQNGVYGVACTVKLHEDKGKTGIRQCLDIVRIIRQAQAVRVQLHIFATGIFREPNHIRQVITQRGLPTAQLQEGFSPSGNIRNPCFY